jgi:predicted dithiol-disulfide oxidoreductase (DUF899 family)
MTTHASDAEGHPVVSHQEWLAASTALLDKEKAFTRLRDELSLAQRQLPWERVEKNYVFDTPKGRQSLADLFAGRTQLVVYHFMFDPEWDLGCPHCSRWADSFNGAIVHLNQRNVTMVVVSEAPLPKLEAYRRRMGWSFTWASSQQNEFNRDFCVSFTPEEVAAKHAFYNYMMQDPRSTQREGVSVFFKDNAGRVFHTYSTYARGIEPFNVDYRFLDVVPEGRNEQGRGPFWVRRHDEY